MNGIQCVITEWIYEALRPKNNNLCFRWVNYIKVHSNFYSNKNSNKYKVDLFILKKIT